jgi:uncharacterized membrane protein
MSTATVSRWGWIALTLLSLAGLGTSAYLTYSHYSDDPTVCAGIGSCEFVQNSEYSEIAGIPVALMGLLYFSAMVGLCGARFAVGRNGESWIRPVAFTMTIGSSLFVIYLTYIELFVIDAICPWCVATAVITLACFVVMLPIVAAGVREEAIE